MYKRITSTAIIAILSILPFAHAQAEELQPKKAETIKPKINEAIKPSTEISLWSQNFLNSQHINSIPAEQIDQKGSYTQISNPRMQVYLPPKSNRKAILVLSGGGYDHLEMGASTSVSQWLAQQGFTVFNLIYRLPTENWNNKQVSFADGQRAMRIIRQKASEYGYEQVGAMGFSAGGHLAGMLGVFPDKNFYPAQDSIDRNSAKPDFIALLYSVVSMLPEKNTTRSRINLLGKNPTTEQEKSISIEQWVNSSTPPMFIAHASDDQTATVDKSIILDQNLKKLGVKQEMHIFGTGGHSWGLGRAGTPTTTWPNLFLNWVNQI